jgi:hypothetical protein
MALYTWPDNLAFKPASFTWGVKANDRLFTSQLSGSIQTASIPGTRWSVQMEFPSASLAVRPALEAFLAKCRREHRIVLWNMARPQPQGTINRTGVTVQSAVAQFGQTATLTGCGASTTLKAGDMLGVPGQLLMVADDATASGGGVMAVNFTHELRQALTPGMAVTLIRPTALFVQTSEQNQFPFLGTHHPSISVELTEVFA